MKRSCIAIAILAVLVTGCAGTAQFTTQTKDQVRSCVVDWPFYSGLIRSALGPNITQLPQQTVTALDDMDRIVSGKRPDKLTDNELGQILGLKIRLVAPLIQQALKQYAPEVLQYLPVLFGGGL